LRHYSGEYTEADIKPWAELLLDLLKKPITYEAVYKKYALKKMMKASLFVGDHMKRVYGVPVHTLRDNGKSVFGA
jgi:G2/mitotic-specific cyclin 1/2